MTTIDTLPLFVAAARDTALAQVEAHAGPCFKARAMRAVVQYLRKHGEASGEDITDACKAAGITPHCDKAFGPVYQTLARDGIIERAGWCARRKGHGSGGAILWRMKI